MTLAEAPEHTLLRIQAIAEQQRIPKRFLEQILNDLRSAGFVESRRGVSGGYRLARPANSISVRDVVEHFEPLSLAGATAVGSTPPAPDAPEEAVLRSVWAQAQAAMLASLEKWSLANLCEQARELRRLRGDPMDFVI